MQTPLILKACKTSLARPSEESESVCGDPFEFGDDSLILGKVDELEGLVIFVLALVLISVGDGATNRTTMSP